jgi:dolichyl-phosphate-mannose--protein O-mannosyl transferase
VPSLLRRLNRPIVAIVAVTCIAAGIRFIHLGFPTDLVFDEVYYAKSACILNGWSDKTCLVDSSDEKYWRSDKWDVGSWVHPPLGKWQIALGEKAFGMTPLGWRSSSAVVGTLTVTALALIAQLLWGSAFWTFITGLLLATEHLNVVESRAALLDIHLEFWVVVGFLLLLLDRRWIDRRTPPKEPAGIDDPDDPDDPDAAEGAEGAGPPGFALPPPGGKHVAAGSRIPSPVWRPWRFAAGIAFAAAFSVKWSGITALGAAILLSLLWETTRRRRGGVSRTSAFGRAIAREGLGLVLAFLVLPIAVYLVAYLPWFNHFGHLSWSPHVWADNLKLWWKNQTDMWHYHDTLKATALDSKTHTYTPTHPYYSRPWTWIIMERPVSYWVHNGAGGALSQIIAIGNPVIFYWNLVAMPYAAWAWRKRGDWRAGFVLVPLLGQWLPWFLVGRPQFFFYVLPMVPFMVLGGVYLAKDLSAVRIIQRDRETGAVVAESSKHPYRPLAWIYVVGAVALFVWFWPVLTGHPLSNLAWRARIWFPKWI